MNRRDFIILLGCSGLAGPIPAMAQEGGKVRRIGFLRVGPPPAAFIDGFRKGLSELGLVEGQHFVIEYGLAQSAAQMPAVARAGAPQHRYCCRVRNAFGAARPGRGGSDPGGVRGHLGSSCDGAGHKSREARP